MEDYRVYINDATRHFKTADHLIYMTYPLVNDKKLLITITQSLFTISQCIVNAVLEYERMHKRIAILPTNFESRLVVFRNKCAKNYNIDLESIKMIEELHELVNDHKESAVEFTRNEQLVICDDGFENMKTVDIKRLKNHLIKIRSLLTIVNNIK